MLLRKTFTVVSNLRFMPSSRGSGNRPSHALLLSPTTAAAHLEGPAVGLPYQRASPRAEASHPLALPRYSPQLETSAPSSSLPSGMQPTQQRRRHQPKKQQVHPPPPPPPPSSSAAVAARAPEQQHEVVMGGSVHAEATALSSSLKQWQQPKQHQLQQIPVQQHQSVLNNQLLNHQMFSQAQSTRKNSKQSGRLG